MASFKTQIRVTWADTDAAQVVHFSNFFKFFERAEEDFYRSLGFNFNEIVNRYGIWLPRVEAFCQYRKPAKFNDLLEIELTVGEIREKAVKYLFTVRNRDTDEILAKGHLTVVAASKNLGKAIKIPEEFVEKLKPFLAT
ncbi:MAG TPA: acyl-CoA thioesterase [Candidatus Bathyarchaeota archaeon]|nr:MAG: acyl-CoA thioesterase [Candidatus Bathyarchaeota archaeon]HDI06871.1 acyl-CoA thioesterase [Candidatus Bathyarchaeota archaeon]